MKHRNLSKRFPLNLYFWICTASHSNSISNQMTDTASREHTEQMAFLPFSFICRNKKISANYSFDEQVCTALHSSSMLTQMTDSASQILNACVLFVEECVFYRNYPEQIQICMIAQLQMLENPFGMFYRMFCTFLTLYES